MIERLNAHNGKVISTVAWNGRKKEWASGGTDGKDQKTGFVQLLADIIFRHCHYLGSGILSHQAGAAISGKCNERTRSQAMEHDRI